MSVSAVLSNPKLTDYIKGNLDDLWFGTFLQGYRYMDNKQKGAFGELFAEEYLTSKKFKVTGRENGNSDHDMVVNGLKVEVKFSIAQTNTNKKTGVKKLIKNKFMMNHVGVGKDYDRLLFIGINPNFEESRIAWFSKKDVEKLINNRINKNDKSYFGFQQGGIHTGNDDFMIGSNKLVNLLNSKYARTLEQW